MEWNDTAGATAGNASGYQQSQSMDSGTTTGSTADAKEKVRQAATDAQQKLTDEFRARAESTRTRAADTLGSVANALSNSSQQLRSESNAAPGDYMERISGQIRRASDYLRNTNTDEIIRNAENMARRQPALFLGGAFALGFLATRLLKSSQPPESGSIPHDRSLVPQPSPWAGDREAPLSGFREPATGRAGFGSSAESGNLADTTRDTR